MTKRLYDFNALNHTGYFMKISVEVVNGQNYFNRLKMAAIFCPLTQHFDAQNCNNKGRTGNGYVFDSCRACIGSSARLSPFLLNKLWF